MICEAFVYSWRNIKTNRLYIGWHKGHINDGYICSSKPLLEEYNIDPSNFERYIISRGTINQMVTLETIILRSVDARNNPEYYNQHNGNGKYLHTLPHTKETREKMSKAHSTRTKYAKGWFFTKESKLKCSNSRKEYFKTLTKEERSDLCYKDSHKKSLAERNKIKLECPHCGKCGHFAAMKRWHFDNCRKIISDA